MAWNQKIDGEQGHSRGPRRYPVVIVLPAGREPAEWSIRREQETGDRLPTLAQRIKIRVSRQLQAGSGTLAPYNSSKNRQAHNHGSIDRKAAPESF